MGDFRGGFRSYYEAKRWRSNIFSIGLENESRLALNSSLATVGSTRNRKSTLASPYILASCDHQLSRRRYALGAALTALQNSWIDRLSKGLT